MPHMIFRLKLGSTSHSARSPSENVSIPTARPTKIPASSNQIDQTAICTANCFDSPEARCLPNQTHSNGPPAETFMHSR